MKKIKIFSSKNQHVVKDGVLFAKPAGIVPGAGRDNVMHISYDLGMKIIIPEGAVALILPPNDLSSFSIAQTGNFVLLPGTHEKVMIDYKLITNAMPRVFEAGEVCAQIVFINAGDSFNFETEIVEDEKNEKEVAAPEVVEPVDPSDEVLDTHPQNTDGSAE